MVKGTGERGSVIISPRSTWLLFLFFVLVAPVAAWNQCLSDSCATPLSLRPGGFSQLSSPIRPHHTLFCNRLPKAKNTAGLRMPPSKTALSANARKNQEDPEKEKCVVLIRHGCSYMNEYIGANGISFGGPGFTDVFSSDDHDQYYRDSPLAPTGKEQARGLATCIWKTLQEDENDDNKLKESLQDLELVVVSPLTRAIETAEYGLLPHIREQGQNVCAATKKPRIPVVALPLAAERLYLVSDIGRPRSVLEHKFGYFVDFKEGFQHLDDIDDPWWFSYSSQRHGVYNEWRPIGKGQTYFCPGEPECVFQQRMMDLCRWLDQRPERTIALVGHFGIFEWLLKKEEGDAVKFANCEMKVVLFDDILVNANILKR